MLPGYDTAPVGPRGIGAGARSAVPKLCPDPARRRANRRKPRVRIPAISRGAPRDAGAVHVPQLARRVSSDPQGSRRSITTPRSRSRRAWVTSVVLIFGHTLAGLVVTGNGTGGLICFDGSSRLSRDFSGVSKK